MSQRISSNKYHKVFWLPRRGYRSLGKQPTYTYTNTLLVYFNMTGKRCGSHKKREREKERKRTTETSKRITRRNNKLTDCEKGKREGHGKRETRTLIDTMTMDRDMVRGSASRRDRIRALVDSEGAGVNDNDNEKENGEWSNIVFQTWTEP